VTQGPHSPAIPVWVLESIWIEVHPHTSKVVPLLPYNGAIIRMRTIGEETQPFLITINLQPG